MNIRKFLIFGLIAAVIGVARADDTTDQATATTKKYVTDELSELQTAIPAQSGTKAVTYTTTQGTTAPREVKTNLGTSTTDTAMPTVSAVNTKLATKQNEIPAADTSTVVTYTDTTGTVGQKGIYQDTGTYATQQSNLIDAGTFNAALQNALNMEFVCAGYVDDDPTQPCWLWQINDGVVNNISLPTGYTQLEYIESTGTQYINTGIRSGGIGIRTEVTLQLTTNSTAEQAIIGFLEYGGGYEVYFANGTRIGTYRAAGQSANYNINYNTNTIYTVTSEMSDNGITQTVNEEAVNYNGTMTLNSGNGRITLFNHYGRYYISAKVFNVKIWNNGTLVRHFIPAKRNSDNEIGLYDKVTGTFFANAGTGEFVAGPIANVYIPQGQ